MNRPTVAIDLDGVISTTPDFIESGLLERGYDVVSFKVYNPLIRNVDDNRKAINEVVHDIFMNKNLKVQPYSPYVDTLFREINIVADIQILTARRMQYHKQTREWLNHYIPSVPIKIAHVKSADKPKYVKDNGILCLVEDRLRTANHAAREGIHTYLVNREWNMGRPTHEKIVRISELSAFQSILASHCKLTNDNTHDIIVKEHVKKEKDLLC